MTETHRLSCVAPHCLVSEIIGQPVKVTILTSRDILTLIIVEADILGQYTDTVTVLVYLDKDRSPAKLPGRAITVDRFS